ASVLDQDAPHRLGRGGKEMTAIVPARFLPVADQAQVGFVNQGRRLQRLPRLFLGQLLGGQLAQLVVDQRQDFARGGRGAGRGGGRVGGLDGGQDLGDVSHNRWIVPGGRPATTENRLTPPPDVYRRVDG